MTYSTKEIVDLILDGHWSISEVTNDTVWRVYRRFGRQGRERLNEVSFCDSENPSCQDIREFELRLWAAEDKLVKEERRHELEYGDPKQSKLFT